MSNSNVYGQKQTFGPQNVKKQEVFQDFSVMVLLHRHNLLLTRILEQLQKQTREKPTRRHSPCSVTAVGGVFSMC